MKDNHDVRTICRIINLHHSVYYYRKSHKENSFDISNKELKFKINEIWLESNKIYGAPKIREALKTKGYTVSLKRVQRLMKQLGIKSIVTKKFKPASSSKKDDNKVYHNLIEQDFSASKPGTKLVGDITYIYTKENGWTYLAVVLDLFDLQVIGYSYGLKMNEALVVDALNKAKIYRHIEDSCIFHSDRGSQYTSNAFENLLIESNMIHSYSKKGYPYDNASMESFNATLKKEEVNLKSYLDYNEARLAIFEFIESWYNRVRIHSSLGYITPVQKYEQYIVSLN